MSKNSSIGAMRPTQLAERRNKTLFNRLALSPTPAHRTCHKVSGLFATCKRKNARPQDFAYSLCEAPLIPTSASGCMA